MTEKEVELGDDMVLRPSPTAQGASAAVAQKGGVDVCANCFRPLGGNFVDLPFGGTWLRVCLDQKCANACARELEGKVQIVTGLESALAIESSDGDAS